ncbi:MAG TPA: ABC transporter permease [Candidatus Eisenbacteria bacterium]|jgi:putative ABC transport system permease protein|nr:ABC transporter permease [Candidatus Eisenbacteria bacterium]
MQRASSMHLTEAVAIATSSLWAHKLRSILTLIGVVIGVTSVIAVVSLINGANQYVATRVFRLGADVFGLSKQPSIITNVDDFLEFQKRKRITYEDFEAVREFCASCKEVGAALGGRVETKSGVNSLKDTNLRAWTPQMPELYDVDLVSGRHITQTDLRDAAPVCVIGNDIVDNLMPGLDPVGKEIRWNNTPCQVIGVGKKEGSALGTSLDNWIILPLTTYKKVYGNQQDSLRVTIRAGAAANIQASVDEVRQIMRGRHHLAYGTKDDFAVETSDSFLELWKNISGSFFVVMIGIASISLIVGGIVIMNIMLVSVTERTREIGVRKAIGARRGDILLQFLIESSTVAAIGGVLGVVFGVLLAKIVSWVTPLPSAVQLWSVIGGLFVALSVGLFFGTYPASKAARLDPVVALRSE